MNRDEGLLLDTCAVLWLFGGSDLTEASRSAIEQASQNDALYLSPISAWEIGMLASKGRIALSMPVGKWVDAAFGHRGARVAGLDPVVLVDSSYLPGDVHGDPADRIIIATARQHQLKVVTRDRIILDYAKRGHVRALEC